MSDDPRVEYLAGLRARHAELCKFKPEDRIIFTGPADGPHKGEPLPGHVVCYLPPGFSHYLPHQNNRLVEREPQYYILLDRGDDITRVPQSMLRAESDRVNKNVEEPIMTTDAEWDEIFRANAPDQYQREATGLIQEVIKHETSIRDAASRIAEMVCEAYDAGKAGRRIRSSE